MSYSLTLVKGSKDKITVAVKRTVSEFLRVLEISLDFSYISCIVLSFVTLLLFYYFVFETAWLCSPG